MPKSTRVLTHLERRIMRVLWESGAGNVQKVLQGLTSEPRRLGTVIKALRGKVNKVGASLFPDYSMSWTLSRNFSTSALISRAKPVIARASLSTPGVLESIVLTSRCISCNRKSSSCLARQHHPVAS
jgi:hypothetical protein